MSAVPPRRHHQLVTLLARAREDLELIARELEAAGAAYKEDGPVDEDVNRDLLEIRARVEALEARVAVIEGGPFDHNHG